MSVEATEGTVQMEPLLTGAILVLVQFDVCEEILLDRLGAILGVGTIAQPSLKHPAPGYAHYERPPVVEGIEELELSSGERLSGVIKYYDYGVLSVVFQLSFSGDWKRLVGLASRWVWDVDFVAYAERIVREKIKRATAAMSKPYVRYLSEDYLIFHVSDISGTPLAKQVVSAYGGHIAKVVRGDMAELAESEIAEVMQSRISYYTTDLAVIGWNAAFLYDTTAGAESAIQLLEYANSQLLEFRHYDELLTRELEHVYKQLEEGTGTFALAVGAVRNPSAHHTTRGRGTD